MSYQPLNIAQGADGYLAFFTGVDGLAGDNDLFYDRASGRLGIGQQNPAAELHISRGGTAPTITATQTSLLLSSEGNNLISVIADDTGVSGISFGKPSSQIRGYVRYSNSTDSMHLRTVGSDAIVIDSSQNVGIGTSTMAYPLHIDAANGRQIVTQNSGNYRLMIGSGASGNEANLETINSLDIIVRAHSGVLRIDKATSGDPQLRFSIADTVKYSMGVDDTDSDKFKIYAGTGVINDHFTIDTSGLVAIGGDAVSGYALTVNKSAEGSILCTTVGGNLVSYLGSSSGVATLYSANARDIALMPTTGFVGINTIDPTTALDIETSAASGGIDINNTATDGDPRIAFQLSGTAVWTLGVDDSNNDKFMIGTTDINTGTIMTFDSAGSYVGINNIAPAYALDIVTNSDSMQRISLDNDNTGASAVVRLQLRQNSGAQAFINAYSSTNTGQYGDLSRASAAEFVGYGNGTTFDGKRVFFGSISELDVHVLTSDLHNPEITVTKEHNVGIGTYEPFQELTVNGVVALQDHDTPTYEVDGYGLLYAKSDNKIYFKPYAQSEIDLTSGGLSETTFQENKAYWDEAIHHLTSAADGYASVAPASIGDGYIAFYDGNNNLAGDSNLFYNRESGKLVLNNSNGINILQPDGTMGLQLTSAGDDLTYIQLKNLNQQYQLRLETSSANNALRLRDNTGAVYMLSIVGQKVGVLREPTTYQLEVQGDAGKTAAGTGWNIISDATEKKEITALIGQDGYDIDGYTALERLTGLRGVLYKWLTPEEHGLPVDHDGYLQGFISQEVEQYFPEWVREDAEGKKWLNMIGFEAYLIEALKEIKQNIEENKARMDEHEARLVALENP